MGGAAVGHPFGVHQHRQVIPHRHGEFRLAIEQHQHRSVGRQPVGVRAKRGRRDGLERRRGAQPLQAGAKLGRVGGRQRRILGVRQRQAGRRQQQGGAPGQVDEGTHDGGWVVCSPRLSPAAARCGTAALDCHGLRPRNDGVHLMRLPRTLRHREAAGRGDPVGRIHRPRGHLQQPRPGHLFNRRRGLPRRLRRLAMTGEFEAAIPHPPSSRGRRPRRSSGAHPPATRPFAATTPRSPLPPPPWIATAPAAPRNDGGI